MARNHAYTPSPRRYRYGTPSGLGPMARDLWQKRDEIVADGEISIHTEPHTVKLFKIKA